MDSAQSRRQAWVVRDHEDGIMAVYDSAEAAEGYIRREWSDTAGPILWRAEAYCALSAGETP